MLYKSLSDNINYLNNLRNYGLKLRDEYTISKDEKIRVECLNIFREVMKYRLLMLKTPASWYIKP